MKAITFNPKEVEELVVKGGNLAFNPDSETALLKLFEMKDKIEEAISKVKETIVKKGRELLPSFKGVEGDLVRAYIKKTDRYTYDKSKEKPLEVMKKIEFYKLDEAKVEGFLRDKGHLPNNVSEKENAETLVFKVKEDETQTTTPKSITG